MMIFAIRDPFGSGIGRLLIAVVAAASVQSLLVMLSQRQKITSHDLTLATAGKPRAASSISVDADLRAVIRGRRTTCATL